MDTTMDAGGGAAGLGPEGTGEPRRDAAGEAGEAGRERRLHLQRPHLRGAVNVSTVERVLSLVGGGALALYGLRRRGAAGTLAGLAGALLVERGATGHCRVYETLGMDTADRTPRGLVRQHGRAAVLQAAGAIRVEHSISVDRPREDLFRYWRTLENLPRIMRHLEQVTVLDERRSRWRAKAPAGQTVEWTAIIHNEIPNELIGWKSLDDASVPNAGSVHFSDAPGGRGTVIRVLFEYDPPAGRLGAVVARLLGDDPDRQVAEDLRRFKASMEAGETPTTVGQPAARA